MSRLITLLLLVFLVSGCADTVVEPHPQSQSTGTIVGYAYLHDDHGNKLTDHAGIQVTISDTDLVSITDAQGRFYFAGIPAGTYQIAYSKDGFISFTRDSVQFDGRDTLTLGADSLYAEAPESPKRTVTISQPRKHGLQSTPFFVSRDTIILSQLLIAKDGDTILLQPGDRLKPGMIYILGNEWTITYTILVEPADSPAVIRLLFAKGSGADVTNPSSYEVSTTMSVMSGSSELESQDSYYINGMGFRRGDRVFVTGWIVNNGGATDSVRSNEVSFVL